MSKSIAVFGAGPGLGQAVARRYAREGYAVTLVGRRPEPLDLVAKELASAGTTAHVITADLSDTGATPRLAEMRALLFWWSYCLCALSQSSLSIFLRRQHQVL